MRSTLTTGPNFRDHLSSLWSVNADPQSASKPEIADSLERNTGHQRLAAERAEIATLLGLDAGTALMDTPKGWSPRPCITIVFAKPKTLSDDAGTRILTALMADSPSVQTPLIGTLGETMDTDMREHWSPEPLFFDLVRDKQMLNAMVGEYAGKSGLDQNTLPDWETCLAMLSGKSCPEEISVIVCFNG